MVAAVKGQNNYLSLVAADTLLPVNRAKKKIVAFSGGKDSLAAVLSLLEMGVPRDEIELWHHLIDGAPGSPARFDWPCTEDYVRAVGEALGIRVRFSWKDGGFEGEMTRENAVTRGVYYEDEDRNVEYLPPAPPSRFCAECRLFFRGDEPACMECGAPRDGFSTRMKYPQVSADLSVRWCSAYLKIMVCRRVLSNDPRFSDGYFWLLSGERREESSARAKYKEAERHSSSNKKRLVHQWRNVIDWTEEQVWAIIRRWNLFAHPCYYLGFSRCSCMCCIFGDRNQWATIQEMAPKTFEWHASNEKLFGLTIKRGESVEQQAACGTSYIANCPRELVDLALNSHYPRDRVFVPQGSQWEIPCGAFKKSGGPT